MSEPRKPEELDAYQQVRFSAPEDADFASRVRGMAQERSRRAVRRNTISATVATMVLITGVYFGGNWLSSRGGFELTPEMFADLEQEPLTVDTEDQLAASEVDLDQLTLLALTEDDATDEDANWYYLLAQSDASDVSDPVESLSELDDESLETALQQLEDMEIEICPEC